MNFATGQKKYIFIIKKLSSLFLFRDICAVTLSRFTEEKWGGYFVSKYFFARLTHELFDDFGF